MSEACPSAPHTGADSGHVGPHELHGVVDAQAGVDHSPGRVDVDLDVSRRVGGLQEQELGLHDVGHIVVDTHSEEYYPVHHQAREHVHGRYVELAFLDDGRVDVTGAHIGI